MDRDINEQLRIARESLLSITPGYLSQHAAKERGLKALDEALAMTAAQPLSQEPQAHPEDTLYKLALDYRGAVSKQATQAAWEALEAYVRNYAGAIKDALIETQEHLSLTHAALMASRTAHEQACLALAGQKPSQAEQEIAQAHLKPAMPYQWNVTKPSQRYPQEPLPTPLPWPFLDRSRT